MCLREAPAEAHTCDVTPQRDKPDELEADRVDGVMTRREAMRRLALVAVAGGPAALVSACSSGRYWPGNRRRRRRR
jgi:hypothetical protein